MRTLAAILLALTTGAAWGASFGTSWVDPNATARQASHLYALGKFGDAAAKYKEALIDDPDSVLLHYNAAAAAYRDGKYEDAIAALRQIPPSDADPARTAAVAYNLGNATYRLGAAKEASKPQDALQRYAEALVAYRRAMGADPADQDAKLNHELVEKKIADLKKKLEEQKKQQQDQQKNPDKQPQDQQQNKDQADQQQQDQQQRQDQQQQDQQQQADQQQQQDRQQQQADQQQQDQQEQAERQQEQQGGEQQQAEQKPDEAKPSDAASDQAGEDRGQPGEQAGGEAVAGDDKSDLPRRDAEAILDAQRDQEVRPDEIVKKLQGGARVAEPREDW